MQFHAMIAHKPYERVYYLHGILRLRENTFIILRNQSDAFVFEPFHRIFMREVAEHLAHQFVASRICQVQILIPAVIIDEIGKTVSQVASPATRHRHLCQWFGATFKHMHLHLRIATLKLNGTEASCRTCADYRNCIFTHFHIADS